MPVLRGAIIMASVVQLLNGSVVQTDPVPCRKPPQIQDSAPALVLLYMSQMTFIS